MMVKQRNENGKRERHIDGLVSIETIFFFRGGSLAVDVIYRVEDI